MKYDVDYFIRMFKRIPQRNFTTKEYRNSMNPKKCCALGHCGVDKAPENFISIEEFRYKIGRKVNKKAQSLYDLVYNSLGIEINVINDGKIDKYQQATPKQRILAALYDIKKLQEEKQSVKEVIKEVIVYKTVEVDSKVKALATEEKILN